MGPPLPLRARSGLDPESLDAVFARLFRWARVRFGGWLCTGDGVIGRIEYKSLVPPVWPPMSRREMLEVLEDLSRLPHERRLIILRTLPRPVVRALAAEWW